MKKNLTKTPVISFRAATLAFFSLLATGFPAGSRALADSSSEFANPWVTDTTDYSSKVVTYSKNFMNGQANMGAPGPSPLLDYCHDKNGGKDHRCVARVSTGPWAADPSVLTDSRGWSANAYFKYTHETCGRISGGESYTPPSTPTGSNDTYKGGANGNTVHAREHCEGALTDLNASPGMAQAIFCPLGSRFRSISGVYTNPYEVCGVYDPFVKCPAYWEDADHLQCTDYDTTCTYKPHGGCSDSQFASYQSQYSACIASITKANVDNQGLGYNDCFCVHETAGVRDYGFMFQNGSWKCLQCAPGMKQRDDTGIGCVSRCPVNQAWINGACQPCPAGEEAFNAKCVAKCDPTIGQVRDTSTGACKLVCPSGLNATPNGVDMNGNPQFKCDCSVANFDAGSVRVPSLPESLPGFSSAVWKYATALTPSNTDAACTCADASIPPNASLYDQSFAIAGPLPANPLPYGMVVMNSVTPGKKVCGCPNFNEKYVLDPVLGRPRCQAQVTGATAYLADVANPADLAASGVLSAKSDAITQTRALLRGAADMSDAYTRRVWKCRPGSYLKANGVCAPIDDSVASQYACSDNAAQVTPSSVLNLTTSEALGPTGSLAGKSFDKLTNRRIACCAQSGPLAPYVMKPSCAESKLTGTFDAYYDVPGGGIADAGIPFPNRFYLRDASGRPVTGLFRSSDGTRCDFPALGPSAEMAMLSEVAKRAVTNPTDALGGPLATAAFGGKGDPRCNQVIRTALEVTCKTDQFDADGNPNWIVLGGVHRCVGEIGAAIVHYDIKDVGEPGKTRRTMFRSLSSTSAGTLATPLDLKSLTSF